MRQNLTWALQAEAKNWPLGSEAMQNKSFPCPYALKISGQSELPCKNSSKGNSLTIPGEALGAKSGPSSWDIESEAYTALFERPSAGTEAPNALSPYKSILPFLSYHPVYLR